MTPEARARREIDRLLGAAGWHVCDVTAANLHAARGVAIREFPLNAGHGEADYLLYVDARAAGVIEAKKQGATLSGVERQSEKCAHGLPAALPAWSRPLPFAYESMSVETRFTNGFDPEPRSRNVFAFHCPEHLASLLGSVPGQVRDAGAPAYVDRGNLARQTKKEFDQYVSPVNNFKFGEEYIVQHLTSNNLDRIARVCISTIQRMYSMLKGRELAEEDDERSTDQIEGLFREPEPIDYDPAFPIETFDIIVTDEAHRSIYNLWRQVLEYFDAYLIGLTATPNKQTFGFFNQNLVMEYGHPQAVADGVNVNYTSTASRPKSPRLEAEWKPATGCRCWTSPPAPAATGSSTTTPKRSSAFCARSGALATSSRRRPRTAAIKWEAASRRS
jgi:type I site-specific restriction endonuclease